MINKIYIRQIHRIKIADQSAPAHPVVIRIK